MPEEIKIGIRSLHELPTAYEKAISIYKYEYKEDCWDDAIRLKHVLFQDNFRRSEYVCVFEVGAASDFTPAALSADKEPWEG